MTEAIRLGRDTRTSLKAWFLCHYTEMAAAHESAAVLDTVGKQRRWNAVAARMRADGLTTRGGAPISAADARRAWWSTRATHRCGKV